MTTQPLSSTPPATRRIGPLFVPLMIGIGVSVALGVYGRVHEPTGIAVSIAGFSGIQPAKVWITTAAMLLAVVQLVTALIMFGKIPGMQGGRTVAVLHRWSGRLAFLLAVPVAVHCLYAFGFATFDTRTLVHSIMGCFFFGAFTAKMLILPRSDTPDWSLPLLGGLVFTGLAVLWLTSSYWFFTTIGVQR